MKKNTGSRPKVLVIEDDEINLFIAMRLLRNAFEVDSAVSDVEALSKIEKNTYDVILMDINLGDNSMDGIEVMKKIKNNPGKAHTKIFAITSYAMPEDREKFLNAGFDQYFPKPIKKDEIISAIENALGK